MDRESQTDALWRKLLREGELVFVGYCTPDRAYIEEKTEEAMVEFFLTRKLSGDRKARKIKVSIQLIDLPAKKREEEDD